MNHTVEECYSKHDYPPWYKQKKDRVTNNLSTSKNTIVTKDKLGNITKINQPLEKKNDIHFTQEQI